MAKRKPKRLQCRWCGDILDRADSYDHRSAWTHSHPSACPFRRDQMPALNGVHVGDVWRNLHTGHDYRVTECRLGGHGTYTDREPTVMLDQVGGGFAHEAPLWSLVEHHDPVTRPGEYPVPFHVEQTGRNAGMRTADDAYRGPFYRGSSSDRERAYWHTTHRMGEQPGCIDWTADRWQIDPDAERTLLDPIPADDGSADRALADQFRKPGPAPQPKPDSDDFDPWQWADQKHREYLASVDVDPTEPQPGEQLTLV